MGEFTSRSVLRKRRKARIRKKVNGTTDRPRLSVFRSHKHIYGQLIDDSASCTLVSASSAAKDVASDLQGKNKKDAASVVGEALGAKAVSKGIQSVVFDRGGYAYHGRVKAMADGARKAGLKF